MSRAGLNISYVWIRKGSFTDVHAHHRLSSLHFTVVACQHAHRSHSNKTALPTGSTSHANPARRVPLFLRAGLAPTLEPPRCLRWPRTSRVSATPTMTDDGENSANGDEGSGLYAAQVARVEEDTWEDAIEEGAVAAIVEAFNQAAFRPPVDAEHQGPVSSLDSDSDPMLENTSEKWWLADEHEQLHKRRKVDAFEADPGLAQPIGDAALAVVMAGGKAGELASLLQQLVAARSPDDIRAGDRVVFGNDRCRNPVSGAVRAMIVVIYVSTYRTHTLATLDTWVPHVAACCFYIGDSRPNVNALPDSRLLSSILCQVRAVRVHCGARPRR